MSFSPIPDLVLESALALKPKDLQTRGITLLLADLDNTLARYGQSEPCAEILAWKARLEESGITLFLLSNSRKPVRVERFARALGVPYQGHSGKPKRTGFLSAMERMGRTPEQTAMVGDQIFTDILGARRSGVYAVLTLPVELAGNPGRYLRYAAETPFRMLGRRNNRRKE